MASPVAARAQQAGGVPTVGLLWHAGSAEEEAPLFEALRQGLKDLGYVEGQNIRLEHRFPNEVPDRLRSMVAELVASKVDVFVSFAPASFWARDATGTIPHVFVFVADPVGSKFVDSLARPGRNATGLSQLSTGLVKKRLQLLQQAIPGLSSIGLLVTSNSPTAPAVIDEVRAEAGEIGLPVQVFGAEALDELEAAFDARARAGVQGVFLTPSGMFFQGRAMIAKLAIAHHLPTSMWAKELMDTGAFMSYGPNLSAMARRAPTYVDKILKGAKPSDLPVEQPTKFELIINLRTARALGIEVPQMLLAQADEVIE